MAKRNIRKFVSPDHSATRDGASATRSNTGANLGFEDKLWAAADKLRGNMDASEYKHVALGLIFLKYISDAFQEIHDKLQKEAHADPEDRDEYLAKNVFWVHPRRRAFANLSQRHVPGQRSAGNAV